MDRNAGPGIRKALLLPAALLAHVAAVAASHTAGGGSTIGFLNTYFLPANAHVSGYSGLLFGVIAPLGIVMLVIYLGLKQVIGDTREVKALAILMALFIIPSGGYKVISNVLLAVFGLGTEFSGASTLTLPLIGEIPAIDPRIAVSVASFFFFAWLLGSNIIGDEEFQGWEWFGAAGMAFLVWIGMGGGVGILNVLGYALFLWIAYEIFESGVHAQRREMLLVGLLGLFFFFFLLSRFELLPQEIQSIAGTLSALTMVIFVAILAIIAAVIFFVFG